MDWNSIKARLLSGPRSSTAPFTLPGVVLEIEPGFVVGTRLEGGLRYPRRVERMGVAELDPHAFAPAPHSLNLGNEEPVRRAIAAVTGVVGNGGGRYGLVVPDGAVRVALLSFETLPHAHAEAEALVRWRMKEHLPFDPEEARTSFEITSREAGQIDVVVVAVKSAVLDQCERLLDPQGNGSALALPSTMALLPLVPESGETGHLLVHACSGSVTTAVVAGRRLRLWRSRDLGRTSPEDLLKGVAAEAARTLASSRDHCKIEVGKVWLCVRPRSDSDILAEVSREVSRPVEFLNPPADLAAGLTPSEQALFERFGAVVAGLISNSGSKL